MKDARKLQEKRSTFRLQMAYSPEKLGPNVKVAREKLHITQEQAAQRSGVAVRTYVAWEHGHAMPRGYNLDNLAKALKASVRDLLDGVNDDEELPLGEQLSALRSEVSLLGDKLDAVLDLFTDAGALAAAIDLRRAEAETESEEPAPLTTTIRPPAKSTTQRRAG